MKKILLFICLLVASNVLDAQSITLSDQAEISVITVDPGHNLYDTFGHSAFRVKDKTLGLDLAFNYGIFDFNTPNFYGKFAEGKLLYDLAAYPFSIFYNSYVKENRSIREQVLNLSLSDKQDFLNFLQNNAKPENKSYYYDFFYDNCATKLKEVSENVLQKKVMFTHTFIEGQDETLRSLIHKYAKSKHPWGTFGIDLALGSVIDKETTPRDYLFLPDNIFNIYAESTIDGKPIVKETKVLFNVKNKGIIGIQILTPTTLFSLLALFVCWITYRDIKKQKRSKWLDFSLFLFTGIIGTIVFLLWFATDHGPTKDNYNILWAFMPNLFVAFVFLKKEIPIWIKKYILLLIILLMVTVILWVFQIQIFAVGILPILLLLVVRYWFLYKGNNFKK